jgi:arabinofuranosyltransferase
MANLKSKTELPQERHKKSLFVTLSIITIIISLIYSYKLKWLGDDIFIAFRYVQNILDGNGFVYNKGEHVEGYTHFLWLVMVTFFAWLKCSPLVTTQVLGIISSIGTLILWSLIGYKISKRSNFFILPFVTIALALNYDYNVWATSGLETAFFSFLLCCSFYTFFFSSLEGNKKLMLTGLYLCLALMTRPDTLLIIALANAFLFLNQILAKTKIQKIILTLGFFNLAILVIYIPYFIWRYNYFGFIFPNTYYDKLGSETLFSKGFYYIWLYFKPHFTSFLIVILPPFVLLPIIKGKVISNFKEYISDRWNAAYLTSILIVYAYLIVFVAKVGGDFMHARFIIPIAPFIYFIIYYSLLRKISVKNLNIAFAVLLLLSFVETKIRLDVFKAPDKTGKIITTLNRDVADERWAYTTYLPIENDIKLGKALHRTFEGIDAKMLVRGGQACLGYFANFPYAQEYHGLTDTLIAHSKIPQRGRIGHEKHATYEYLQSKGIHFVFNRTAMSKDEYKYAQMDVLPYQVRVEIITYDNKIINQLKERLGEGFKYTDFQMYLDNYIQTKLPSASKEELKKDYDSFSMYYFKHNDDKLREEKFLQALK